MAKIQDVGIGNYIRNPRGVKTKDGGGMGVEALRIDRSEGNSFLCFPVTSKTPLTLDRSRGLVIPRDSEVEQVTI